MFALVLLSPQVAFKGHVLCLHPTATGAMNSHKQVPPICNNPTNK